MRKILLALSTFAAAVLVVSAGSRTEAAPLGNPGALTGALEDVAVVDSVHCRPGWRHHRPNDWRRVDGCRRGYSRSDVYIVPGRTRYIYRDGVRVRVGAGERVRGGDRVRTRTDVNVNVRGGEGRRGGEVRDGGRRGGAAVQGGARTGGEPTAGRGGRQGGAGGGQGGGAAQPGAGGAGGAGAGQQQ